MSPETVALWHFDEAEDYMRPADVLGNVTGLVPVVTNRPAIVHATFGLGRQMAVASARAYRGTCPTALARRALKLSRSFTVDAVLTFNTDPVGAETLFNRGLTTSSAERQLLCCQFLRSVNTLRFLWEDPAGLPHTADVTGVVMPSGPLYVAFVREWRSPTDVECLAYVNGRLVGTVTSTDGDIEDGDSGEVMVGARYNGVAYVDYLAAEVDELRVAQGARSAEEIEHTYKTLFEYPTWGFELIRNSSPPGTSYPDNPESKVLRNQMIEGDAMALAWSKLDELALFYHPDVAWSQLEHWEKITRIAPLPTDSIQMRRDRIVGHLRKVAGFSRTGIREAVYGVLGFTEPDDVPLVEVSNKVHDPLTSLAVWWYQVPNAGTITTGGVDVTLALQGGDDGRWSHLVDAAVRLEIPTAAPGRVEVVVAIERATLASLAVGSFAGLFARGTDLANADLFGVFNDLGTLKFSRRSIVGGVSTTSAIGIPVPACTKLWLRMKRSTGGTWDFAWRLDGSGYFGTWTQEFILVASASAVQMAGLFLEADTNPSAGVQAVDFTDWRLWCPDSRNVYNWYIYVDPIALPEADLSGAQVIIDKMKPAHTNGRVIQSLIMLCDDPYSLCDRDPLGV